MTPRVSISLAPDGTLRLELPGASHSGSRSIPLRRTASIDPTDTILRVLLAQAQSSIAIGEDGAPTRAQVEHWERHRAWPDGRCVFCRGEAAAKGENLRPHRSSHKFDARYVERELGDGVSVRRIPAGATGSAKDRAREVKEAREAAERAKWNKPVRARNARELGL